MATVLAFFLFAFPINHPKNETISNPVKTVTDIKALELLAEKGDAKAQVELAKEYEKGEAVVPDYKLAFKWFAKAAEQTNLDAYVGLGELYDAGRAPDNNPQKALEYYTMAAEKGNVTAQYNLAELYATGNSGIRPNLKEAIRWMRLAAENGDSLAQLNLGRCYARGKGVPVDNVEAYAWLIKVKNIPDTAEDIKRLESKMTSAEIEKARKKADGYGNGQK